ncbi:MAG: DUF5657 family protein [Candidatus Beckwithbacteria bacterium]
MPSIESILKFITQNWRLDALILGKAGVLMFLFLYFMFSLVVLRQINLMSRTVTTGFDKILVWAARGLILLAVAVFILGLILL